MFVETAYNSEEPRLLFFDMLLATDANTDRTTHGFLYRRMNHRYYAANKRYTEPHSQNNRVNCKGFAHR
jgi:hypothetical protein